MAVKSKVTKRLYCVWLNDGNGWLMVGCVETPDLAVKYRDWYLNKGCRPGNLRITQDNADGSANRPE